MTNVFFASGLRGNEVRANGRGGLLAHGFYFLHDKSTYGPFKTKHQAEFVHMIVDAPSRRRYHENEFIGGELRTLAALRDQNIIARVGVYLTPEARDLFIQKITVSTTE